MCSKKGNTGRKANGRDKDAPKENAGRNANNDPYAYYGWERPKTTIFLKLTSGLKMATSHPIKRVST